MPRSSTPLRTRSRAPKKMRRNSTVITQDQFLDRIRNQCTHQGAKWQVSHLEDLFPGWLAGCLPPGRTGNAAAACLCARRCSGVWLMGAGEGTVVQCVCKAHSHGRSPRARWGRPLTTGLSLTTGEQPAGGVGGTGGAPRWELPRQCPQDLPAGCLPSSVPD